MSLLLINAARARTSCTHIVRIAAFAFVAALPASSFVCRATPPVWLGLRTHFSGLTGSETSAASAGKHVFQSATSAASAGKHVFQLNMAPPKKRGASSAEPAELRNGEANTKRSKKVCACCRALQASPSVWVDETLSECSRLLLRFIMCSRQVLQQLPRPRKERQPARKKPPQHPKALNPKRTTLRAQASSTG